MSDENYSLEVKGLDKLLKALKGKPPLTRVGVLGAIPHTGGAGDTGGKHPTDAEIGAAHEYGAPARGLPQRSFLRVPIADLLEKRMEASGAFKEDVLKEVIKSGTLTPWMQKVGALAKGISVEAFETGGFGKWPKWKNPNYTNNANMLLVDTTQLRDSVMFEVKD